MVSQEVAKAVRDGETASNPNWNNLVSSGLTLISSEA